MKCYFVSYFVLKPNLGGIVGAGSANIKIEVDYFDHILVAKAIQSDIYSRENVIITIGSYQEISIEAFNAISKENNE
jgi:hypothetical protein